MGQGYATFGGNLFNYDHIGRLWVSKDRRGAKFQAIAHVWNNPLSLATHIIIFYAEVSE